MPSPEKLTEVEVCKANLPLIKDTNLLECKLLLRLDEVAAILRCSRANVYRLIQEGILESPPMRPVRVKTESLKDILDAWVKYKKAPRLLLVPSSEKILGKSVLEFG